MFDVTDRQRATIRQAAAFALWRDPSGSAVTLMAARSDPRPGPVFGAKDASFALAPFATRDGSEALHIAADVIDGPDGLHVQPGADALLAGTPGPFQAPQVRNATPPTARADYEARIARVIADIRAGAADKVVISRVEPISLGGRDTIAVFEALARAYPSAFVALVSSRPTGTWLVATPETLLHADADGVRTMALAGTQWPDPGTDIDTLEWPDKIVTEQGIVAAEIRAAFADTGFTGVKETPPKTVQAANLCHLRSDFSARSTDAGAVAKLLRRLHPTSAVCGMPRAAARDIILREEGDTRGFYTGYLGPCGMNGATSLYVNLRSAHLSDDTAYLHVGGGIVAASDPATEWQETVEKARTIGDVLAHEAGT